MANYCRISTRKSGAVFFNGALALMLLAGGALAQATTSQMNGLKLNRDEPIQIESDKLEIHDQEHTADFTGNVKVVQGGTTLQAGHMTVYYKAKGGDAANADANGASKASAADDKQASTSIASGNADIDHIIVTDKVFLSSGTQTATADNGSFDMAKQLFILKGEKVVLSDGPNVFTGCQLTVHMATGQAQLDSCGGRVQIQLDPKSQKKN
ncbi:LPS ABC transporter substrate-binding protein LptA [Rhizobium grahamii]|uniref:LPS ABC transporter substrate-binding protein LptA n=1 Tax=Rhizobium grahamii TaxID=1120045 RepID=A0A5Q0CEJ2_9HYPH|nr:MULTISPECIES: LptA/OstA family protein [Rhizobium]QFY62219.1 LPS ABC transporter substrate-binding protein LptA [Rhizobium grahamii]QRM48594.1 LPS ABC transporter substrate-binding protein LptA [Rhizobium sp. BG6]